MIHKTAIVDAKAKISENAKIGPYSIIGPNVEIGHDTVIHSHVNIVGNTKVGKNKLFYDVIYNPSETNFLNLGKKLGNKYENGKLMFIYQAFSAFKLWHGIEPSINEETIKILDR